MVPKGNLPEKITYIGNVPILGDIVSAPMDGISDSPYRIIARMHGAALSFTEFINAQDVVQNNPILGTKLKFEKREKPLAFQLYDNDPERMLTAALTLRDQYEFDILDVNFGCANKRVTSRGAGAALLKTPETIGKIISALSIRLDVPITAKIRLGWNNEEKNHLLISKIIEDNGAKCITVHARTQQQRFVGKPDWHAISEIKNLLSIPVIGNGDVKTPKDINDIRSSTNCDAVMVGRASIGNPWIFSQLDKHTIDTNEIKKTAIEHLSLSISHYGMEKGIIVFRKHFSKYLELLHCQHDDKKRILISHDINHISEFIDSL